MCSKGNHDVEFFEIECKDKSKLHLVFLKSENFCKKIAFFLFFEDFFKKKEKKYYFGTPLFFEAQRFFLYSFTPISYLLNKKISKNLHIPNICITFASD